MKRMNDTPLRNASAARVPKAELAALAPLRRLKEVSVQEEADFAWIVWPGQTPSVVAALLPASGVIFYERREGEWLPLGKAIPEFMAPADGEMRALDRVIVPAPAVPAPAAERPGQRVRMSLAPCREPHPLSALRCSIDLIIRWAETATAWEIEQLSGAVNGSQAWLRGPQLPILPRAEKFWGDRVLISFGFRAEPDWPENALRQAAAVDDDEILVLSAEGPEAIPAAAFQPLTRARIRKLKESVQRANNG